MAKLVEHFENNPRQISQKQFDRLKATMAEFGDLSGIVLNVRTGEIVGGNQRSEAGDFLNKKPVITEEFKKPLADGTVAVGYYELEKGKRFSYRAVDWDKKKAIRANLIANLGGGTWDMDALASLDVGVLKEAGFDDEFLNAAKDIAVGVQEMLAFQKSQIFADMFEDGEGSEEVVADAQPTRQDNPDIFAINIPCDKNQREFIISTLNKIKKDQKRETILAALMYVLENYEQQ